MAEEVKPEITIVRSADRKYYCIAPMRRECGIWLGIEKLPPPVPLALRKPGLGGAAVMRGRDYYREFTTLPVRQGESAPIAADDDLVNDYIAAAWWTPGIEEMWVEAQGLHESIDILKANFDAQVRQTIAQDEAALAQDSAAKRKKR